LPRALTPDEHALLVALIRSDPEGGTMLQGLWNRRVREARHKGMLCLTFEPLPDGVVVPRPKIVMWNNMRGDVNAHAIFTDSDGVIGNIALKIDPDTFDLAHLRIYKVDYSQILQFPTADAIRFPRSRKGDGDRTYSDEYATCEGCSARLLIYSTEVPRAEITSLLGFEPTDGRAKGEPFNKCRPGAALAKWHMWFYRTTRLVPSLDVRRHVDHVLERLDGRADALASLRARPGTDIRFSCTWWSRYGHGGPKLWSRQLRALADLGLGVEFEFVYDPDD
jgi:hypothetical protein